jgi:5-methylcytosine-specific restriction protein A
VAKAKKAQMRELHGKLFCEDCRMDPIAVFGGLDGEACIEVHHRETEVADMVPGHVTKLTDVECLCANCHRVRHRKMKNAKIAVDE